MIDYQLISYSANCRVRRAGRLRGGGSRRVRRAGRRRAAQELTQLRAPRRRRPRRPHHAPRVVPGRGPHAAAGPPGPPKGGRGGGLKIVGLPPHKWELLLGEGAQAPYPAARADELINS